MQEIKFLMAEKKNLQYRSKTIQEEIQIKYNLLKKLSSDMKHFSSEEANS